MLKKIFGKKNNSYFLELKETAEEVLSSTKEVVENQVNSVQEVVESSAVSTKKAVKKQVQTVENQTESTLKPKKEKPNSQKPAATTQPNGGASSFEPPFWVKAMYNQNSSNGNGKAAQSEQTFATNHLMPVVSKSRRRPGPSLNKFKEMANKSKAPRS